MDPRTWIGTQLVSACNPCEEGGWTRGGGLDHRGSNVNDTRSRIATAKMTFLQNKRDRPELVQAGMRINLQGLHRASALSSLKQSTNGRPPPALLEASSNVPHSQTETTCQKPIGSAHIAR